MSYKYFAQLLFCLFLSLNATAQSLEVCLSPEEQKLFDLINKYRKSKKLSAVPYSARLTRVAQLHVQDLENNYSYSAQNKCNPHSWSDQGNWTACCYTSDHREAACMWNKPKEITGYAGNGYEIAFYHSQSATAENALAGWQQSKGHNEVIINLGIWQKVKWNAMGIGIYGKYAVVWFGELADESELEKCKD
ncbi:MAG TPA: CAP domain-containing protein [Cyclobacteriaceae bacterium]|nr:CAP domain-containing protein [Cyclobacteriaceae bacterium]